MNLKAIGWLMEGVPWKAVAQVAAPICALAGVVEVWTIMREDYDLLETLYALGMAGLFIGGAVVLGHFAFGGKAAS